MHIAVTGASGLVGSTLVPLLITGGHQVTKLDRRIPVAGETTWNLQTAFNASSLEEIDAVAHLAGENIAGARWSAKVKEKIRNSRVQGTRLYCEGLAKMSTPPRVLVCALAIGFYGDRGDEAVTEESAVGSGFLAEVAQESEAATQPARVAGIRVVNLRFGVILSPKDGAFAKMLLPFKLAAIGISESICWTLGDSHGALQRVNLRPNLALCFVHKLFGTGGFKCLSDSPLVHVCGCSSW